MCRMYYFIVMISYEKKIKRFFIITHSRSNILISRLISLIAVIRVRAAWSAYVLNLSNSNSNSLLARNPSDFSSETYRLRKLLSIFPTLKPRSLSFFEYCRRNHHHIDDISHRIHHWNNFHLLPSQHFKCIN